jgi:hypothetical protein
MSRREIYREIKHVFDEVPAYFDAVPDKSLELEWRLCKREAERIGDSPASWGMYFEGMRIQPDEIKAQLRRACELAVEAPAAAAR